MRQIKFRGQTIVGEWVTGNLSILEKDFYSTVKKGYYISNSTGSPFAFMVRPESVGQFTGLHDKNGVEIYEGDRLRHNDNIFVVKYSENQHVLLLRVENDKGMNWRSLQWLAKVSKYCKVIGNIHTTHEGKEESC